MFTHQFSPAAILSAARQLYGKCPDGFAVSICGECFDHGDTLSAKVTENLPYLVARIKDLVAKWTALLRPSIPFRTTPVAPTYLTSSAGYVPKLRAWIPWFREYASPEILPGKHFSGKIAPACHSGK